MIERRGQIGELVACVDHRLQREAVDSPAEVFEGAAMADADALHRQSLQHQRADRAGYFKTVQHADDRDAPADGGRFDRAAEMGAADCLDDMVGAAIVGQAIDRFDPVFRHCG